MKGMASAEGLNTEEARRRLLQFGSNLIYRRQKVTAIAVALIVGLLELRKYIPKKRGGSA
jgi:hypothetical protein